LLALFFIVMSGRHIVADDDAGSVAESPTAVRPLLIGAEVPDILLRGVDGSEVSLRQRVAGKPSVIIFYRGGW
jgi:hypothetical protein